MSFDASSFRTIDFRGAQLTRAFLRRSLPRPTLDVRAALDVVAPVIDAVRERGSEAALEFGERFDGVRPDSTWVPAAELERAAAELDDEVREALEVAIERVRAVSEASRPTGASVRLAEGAEVLETFLPIERVGVYVPGGRAVLPSSVVMNVVPAQAAGVKEIVVASPPQKDFGALPHPTILAACHMLGIRDVLAVGGAQAIALLAYGSEGADQVEGVDLISGPGNVYVAAAKRAVKGVVGIDAEAGPTEIAVLADSSARPDFVAVDLISQAEHDPLAASILITDSAELIDKVRGELQARVPHTKHGERVAEALSGPQSAAVLVDTLDAGIAVANAYGAEHLEIHVGESLEGAARVADRITNAGAIFVGEYAPVSLGDYAAGSNHVLPTGGSSASSSGLSVHTFLRPVDQIRYTKAGLEGVRRAAETLAVSEDLPAHGEAITARFA